jgi:predicted AlkP superfamily pyrophosphatase or phosphodiesterase
LAAEASRQLQLGADEHTDLLIISVSGTDYTGHNFGPHSWEYLDHLVRADVAVGRLLAELERQTSLTVMLTADHGVAPLPEHSRAEGKLDRPLRLLEHEMVSRVDAQLDAEFDPLEWFAAQVSPFVYFSDSARARPDFATVKFRAQRLYEGLEGVDRVYTSDQARAFASSREWSKVVVANSFATGSLADLIILTDEYVIFNYLAPGGGGTHHGTHHDYDQRVPLLFYGVGVAHSRHHEVVDQLRTAGTLAELMAIAPPKQASAAALPVGQR